MAFVEAGQGLVEKAALRARANAMQSHRGRKK